MFAVSPLFLSCARQRRFNMNMSPYRKQLFCIMFYVCPTSSFFLPSFRQLFLFNVTHHVPDKDGILTGRQYIETLRTCNGWVGLDEHFSPYRCPFMQTKNAGTVVRTGIHCVGKIISLRCTQLQRARSSAVFSLQRQSVQGKVC